MGEFHSDYAGLDKATYRKLNKKGTAFGSEYFTPTMPTDAAKEMFKYVKRGTPKEFVIDRAEDLGKFVVKSGAEGGKFLVKETERGANRIVKNQLRGYSNDTFGDDGGSKLITTEDVAERQIRKAVKRHNAKKKRADAKAVEFSSRNMDVEYKKALANGDFKTFENNMKAGDKNFNVSKVLERKDTAADSHKAYKEFHKKATQKKFSRKIYKERRNQEIKNLASQARKSVTRAAVTLKNVVVKIFSKPQVLIFLVAAFGILLIIHMIFLFASSIVGTSETSGLASTYLSEDAEIYACETYYKDREDELKDWVDNIETNYPGYDEYDYSDVASIEHNPYAVSSYLSALLHRPFTAGEVTGEEDTFFETQYNWYTTDEWVEREEPDEDEYGNPLGTTHTVMVHVLYVHVKNKGEVKTAYELLDSDGDQMFSTQFGVKGQKAYLWAGYNADETDGMNTGSRQHYQVPRNLLSDDPAFASLYSLADSLIGTPYVWGGTDTDGFDCSGFVYYVYNNSGYASMPRLTAQDLFYHCDVVSADEVKPGDLVFLTNTYASGNTVTHVAIYVGNYMVINCGDPVKYCNITTGWWKRHFYAYGRLS